MSVGFSTPSLGFADILVGSALPGYQTPTAAGISDGAKVAYRIADAIGWEKGIGTYRQGTIYRSSDLSSNGGMPIRLTGNAQVFIETPDEPAEVDTPDRPRALAASTGRLGGFLVAAAAGEEPEPRAEPPNEE
jgi:hypothetical protein